MRKAPVDGSKIQQKLQQLVASMTFHQTSQNKKGNLVLDNGAFLKTLPRLFKGDFQQDVSEFFKVVCSNTCIGNLFTGELIKVMTCKKCQTMTFLSEEFHELNLPAAGNNMPLDELLGKYFKPEDVSKKCSVCTGGSDGEHTLHVTVKKMPDILVLNLMPYDNTMEKARTIVSTDPEISILCNGEKHLLHLVGQARHYGKNRGEGHWAAECSGSDKQKWYQASDTTIETIDRPRTAGSLMFFSKESSMPTHEQAVPGIEILPLISAGAKR